MSEWRDISTAPKEVFDGREIIVCYEAMSARVVASAYWDAKRDYWRSRYTAIDTREIVGYQPLPPPPEKENT